MKYISQVGQLTRLVSTRATKFSNILYRLPRSSEPLRLACMLISFLRLHISINLLSVQFLSLILSFDDISANYPHIDYQYELARAAPLLAKQSTILATEPINNAAPASKHTSITDRSVAAIDQHTEICLSSLLRISGYYAGKIAPDERSANTVMRRIAEEIEKDGVMINGSRSETAQVMQAETAFERLLYACILTYYLSMTDRSHSLGFLRSSLITPNSFGGRVRTVCRSARGRMTQRVRKRKATYMYIFPPRAMNVGAIDPVVVGGV
jgi:hypothetical protein